MILNSYSLLSGTAMLVIIITLFIIAIIIYMFIKKHINKIFKNNEPKYTFKSLKNENR